MDNQNPTTPAIAGERGRPRDTQLSAVTFGIAAVHGAELSAQAASHPGRQAAIASVPVAIAPPPADTNPDAALLALAPILIPMLDEYDRRWAALRLPYAVLEQRREVERRSTPQDQQLSSNRWPEWHTYLSVRAPADSLDDAITSLVQTHMDAPARTLEGLLLKCRIGQSLSQFADDAAVDLDRLCALAFGAAATREIDGNEARAVE